MINFGDVFKRLEKMTSDNSPTILTTIGVIGCVTTGLLASRASFFAAAELYYEAHGSMGKARDRALTSREKFDLTWKFYIPPVSTAALTIAAIIGANRIGAKRAAALAAAYSVTERAFDAYREKVVEKFGERKEQDVRDEVAQDQVAKQAPSTTIIVGEGRQLCYESFTGRYFYSDMETIRRAQNNVNQRIISDNYASLADLYDELGIPQTSESNEVGWTTDYLLDIKFSGVISEGRPCIAIDYRTIPIRDYGYFK